jgi:Sulfotransferase family
MARAQTLMNRASSETGLTDFGDPSFSEGLEILVDSADREARFTEMGAAAFDAQIVDHLSSRLQVEDWYRRHPEIDDQQIVAPLIGLGLPRTGSTALSCLLAEDPAARSIRNWEAMAPCPPPELATQDNDPRIARAEASMVRRSQLFPRAKQMLPSTATSPSECQTFMAMDFKSQLFQAFAHIPTYMEWLNHQADLVPTYLYVKRILKLLQWKCPPTRWRLKNPSHSLFIGALDEVFPDAKFWMTHRDVAKVIPSVSDLYLEYSSAFSDDVDKHWLGEITTDFCELAMQRMIKFRDDGNDPRFFDIHFAPFQKDPFPFLQELYDWLGEDLSDEAVTRMRAWREGNARDKHGSHSYHPADFGIDLDALTSRFAFYTSRFGVQ